MRKVGNSLISIMLCSFLVFTGLLYGQEKEAENKEEERNRFSFSIGYKQHYAWWDPIWSVEKFASFIQAMLFTYKAKFEADTESNFLYNPVLSFKLTDRWSVSGSFLYGKYSSLGRGIFPAYYYQGSNISYILYERKLNYQKYDSDLLFNVKLTDYCKFFFGPKYQGYTIKERGFTAIPTWTNGIMPVKKDRSFHSLGLGLGVSFNVHIAAGLFLLSDVSAISLVGKDFSESSSEGGMQISTLIGCSGSVSLAYYIEKAHLTVSMGYKCQYLYYLRLPYKLCDQNYDLFHGPSVSVIYTY